MFFAFFRKKVAKKRIVPVVVLKLSKTNLIPMDPVGMDNILLKSTISNVIYRVGLKQYYQQAQ
jgi:hypothetical protein